MDEATQGGNVFRDCNGNVWCMRDCGCVPGCRCDSCAGESAPKTAPKHNHWNGKDLVIEERTMFRQVGWLNQITGDLARECPQHAGAFSPVYQQIAVDRGEGWED